jgi:predicted double-glycine peptidase
VELVSRDQFPIILVDRSSLDQEFSIHAVIPIRFTAHYVQVLDPLLGERRLSRRKFFEAHRRVGRWGVVWQASTANEASEMRE